MELKRKQRLALNALFFQSGLCFSTWASRIPDIKESFDLSDGALGAILLIRPVGALIGLPISGIVVDKFGSRPSATVGAVLFSFALLALGFSPSVPFLIASLLLFGLAANLINISANAQALLVQKRYGRVIMASFHGLWSLAGFFGAGVGAIALFLQLDVVTHFLFVAGIILLILLISYPHLSTDSEGSTKKLVLKKPDRHLLQLGLIAFFGLICEGCMFDWSSVYFKEVVKAEDGLIVAGFMSFMGMMAFGRLISDSFTNRFGSKSVIQLSGILIFSGLLISVLLPNIFTAIIGFLMVGAGTSSVIPLTYNETGKNPNFPSGMALAMVSTMGYFGFLLGPPVIGFIADLLSLRVSFVLVALAGLTITVLISFQNRRNKLQTGETN